MPLILRTEKNDKLTATELDENFRYLGNIVPYPADASLTSDDYGKLLSYDTSTGKCKVYMLTDMSSGSKGRVVVTLNRTSGFSKATSEVTINVEKNDVQGAISYSYVQRMGGYISISGSNGSYWYSSSEWNEVDPVDINEEAQNIRNFLTENASDSLIISGENNEIIIEEKEVPSQNYFKVYVYFNKLNDVKITTTSRSFSAADVRLAIDAPLGKLISLDGRDAMVSLSNTIEYDTDEIITPQDLFSYDSQTSLFFTGDDNGKVKKVWYYDDAMPYTAAVALAGIQYRETVIGIAVSPTNNGKVLLDLINDTTQQVYKNVSYSYASTAVMAYPKSIAPISGGK